MSLYSVHLIARNVGADPAFRQRMQADPEDTMAEFSLTEAERTALLSGDVRMLLERGAHGYLLAKLAIHGIGNLTVADYVERIHEGEPL